MKPWTAVLVLFVIMVLCWGAYALVGWMPDHKPFRSNMLDTFWRSGVRWCGGSPGPECVAGAAGSAIVARLACTSLPPKTLAPAHPGAFFVSALRRRPSWAFCILPRGVTEARSPRMPKTHPITGMQLEDGIGCLDDDTQALVLHCAYIEQTEGEKAAEAMRAKVKAAMGNAPAAPAPAPEKQPEPSAPAPRRAKKAKKGKA
jgi:hypothetical protein